MSVEELGAEITRLREARAQSQGDLASLSGVSQPAISRLERGLTQHPSAADLANLARHFGVHLGYLAAVLGVWEEPDADVPPEIGSRLSELRMLARRLGPTEREELGYWLGSIAAIYRRRGQARLSNGVRPHAVV